MEKRYYCLMFVLMLLLCACPKKDNSSFVPEVEEEVVEEITKNIDVKINRYDRALFNINKDSLAQGLSDLQKDYRFFVGDKPNTPENIRQMTAYLNDPVVKQLYKQVEKVFPDCEDLEKGLTEGFGLLKYYYPNATIPKVYGIVSGLYYEMPVIYQDTVLVIGLDMYLGSNYKLYKQLGAVVPQYMYRRFSKEYILSDCFKEMAFQYISFKNSNTALEEMLIEGKRMMFAQLMSPTMPDSILLGYSHDKMQWLIDNQSQIWGFLIEKNLLYSKDKTVVRKLVGDAPFSPYFGKQSPGKVGAWVGLQICRAWIKNNSDKPVTDLFMEKEGQKILTQSKYKPQK
ncbi:MAG: hypothetical protein J5606_08270 [Bacteroidales bacterium]|nr:hypothetical protein [Bacteroidales bacterium]